MHIPVLLHEVTEGLHIQKNKKYIDATFGFGGHAKEIVRLGGIVLGIEADRNTIRQVRSTTSIVYGNFKNLKQLAIENGFTQVAGILFDLGYSSWQLDASGRGFSFENDEPLDMRLDTTAELTAHEVVNSYPVEKLTNVISTYGEEEKAEQLANSIVRSRPITTSRQLRQLFEKEIGGVDVRRRIAKVFQAIRIEVNGELESLKQGLKQAIDLLEPEGRIAVISFHSLEDRIVKFTLRDTRLALINKKPIVASTKEIRENSRARSAKLRIAKKL
ncbi:16S rRNA (cytosine(1402)-N(4))-methyltransferase RsmH [Candidatus Roizmanbacteria bacterium]|nr:16S rRNA (cytosine(1402)-N(4))-methyltransferase RsmH [Candidatus Roizmanbacteria bacterium]